MTEPTMIKGVHAWLLALPPEFAFLLILPLLVATAGLLKVAFFGPGRGKIIGGKEQKGAVHPDSGPSQAAEKPVVRLTPSRTGGGGGIEASSQHSPRDGTLRKGAAS